MSTLTLQRTLDSVPASGLGHESLTITNQYRDAIRHYTAPVWRETNEQRFAALALQWHQDIAFVSSIDQIVSHPAYRQIIGMGINVIPFILHELKQTPAHWFWALHEITGENPIRAEHRGNMLEMSADWVRWGKERGYIA